MTDNNAGHMRVGVLTDAQNRASYEFLDAVLHLKAQAADSGFPKYHRSDSVLSIITDIHLEEDRRTVLNKFAQGDQILVVSLGVPGRPDAYKESVHAFLDLWGNAPQKPVLLVVSENQELTQKVVDSWPGWNA